MKLKPAKLAAVLASIALLTLAGCGGGSDSVAPQDTSSNVLVSPALGKFSDGAQVTIQNMRGDTLGTANISGGKGNTLVSIGNYSGPILIEVKGGAGVTYYDEGGKTDKPFGATDILRAIAPSVLTQVGVTSATHAAVAAIKAKNGGTIPAAITSDDIKVANHKIEVALGITDVLQTPKLLDATSPKLNIALPEDQYALKLAALAKLATNGKTAYDVATDLANDLADDMLDGKFTSATGRVTLNSSTSYTSATFNALFENFLKEAATEFGDENTKTIILNASAVLGQGTPNVSNVVAPLDDLQKAKAMFSELRTTLKSFFDASSKTGFLNTQAQRARDDLAANVSPELKKVASRINAMNFAISALETSGAPLVKGSLSAAWYGFGSYDSCTTTSTATKVTCVHAGSDSADRASGQLKMVEFTLTRSTAENQYSYVAKRKNSTFLAATNSFVDSTSSYPDVPTGSGTIVKSANSITLNGTLPPSTTATGVDTVAFSAIRTNLVDTDYRYALSGSVSTPNTVDTTKVVTLSLNSGSYIDQNETALTGNKLIAVNLTGTAQTAATQFNGTLTMTAFQADKAGLNYEPTSVVFSGSISDTSTDGAGKFLTGKLEAGITDYKTTYHSMQPESKDNYKKVTLAFTGTVQVPARPLMTLVLAATATGPSTATTTLNYSYGAVSIFGTDSMDSITLSNQDGIQMVLTSGVDSVSAATKSGKTLATITNSTIKYIDGDSESLI